MGELPTGTVTFLFTDIEGSTPLAQQFPVAWPALLVRHHAILHEAMEAHHGHVFQIVGYPWSSSQKLKIYAPLSNGGRKIMLKIIFV
jgi:class 3 adenylate cyclase